MNPFIKNVQLTWKLEIWKEKKLSLAMRLNFCDLPIERAFINLKSKLKWFSKF